MSMSATVDKLSMIVETPDVCGGSARIQGTRIPIWGLQQARNQGFTDPEILEMYPQLNSMQLNDAWEYVQAHQTQIVLDLAANGYPK